MTSVNVSFNLTKKRAMTIPLKDAIRIHRDLSEALGEAYDHLIDGAEALEPGQHRIEPTNDLPDLSGIQDILSSVIRDTGIPTDPMSALLDGSMSVEDYAAQQPDFEINILRHRDLEADSIWSGSASEFALLGDNELFERLSSVILKADANPVPPVERWTVQFNPVKDIWCFAVSDGRERFDADAKADDDNILTLPSKADAEAWIADRANRTIYSPDQYRAVNLDAPAEEWIVGYRTLSGTINYYDGNNIHPSVKREDAKRFPSKEDARKLALERADRWGAHPDKYVLERA